MNRREASAVIALLVAFPRVSLAQGSTRIYRIAYLDEAGEKTRVKDWAALRRRLGEHGLIEGKNVVYEARFAGGQMERLASLAAELVAAKPDVIVCPGTPTTRAALRATASIPIVFVAPGDPVGTGLIASLAHPGGNATGFSSTSPETYQKTLELLRELSPGVQRIAFITDPSSPATNIAYSRLEESARKLKLSIRMLDGLGQAALERSFATIRRDRVQGLLIGTAGVLLDYRDQIVKYAAREKLPVIYGRREYVDAGGLLSYGIDRIPIFIRTADLVFRILHGAKPADIPVEQLSSFRILLNLKTARALGIKIPESVRVRVDEVIE